MQGGAQAARGLTAGGGSVSGALADAEGCRSGMLAIDRGSVLDGLERDGREWEPGGMERTASTLE